MVITGDGELGFDSGEGAWETATTSKEGSRRANYPILTQGGSDNKYQYEALTLCNWNEKNTNRFPRINWRASLVPAAAVIPAPIAYIKVVAVKTLVVGFLSGTTGLSWVSSTSSAPGIFLGNKRALHCVARKPGRLLWGNESASSGWPPRIR